MRVTELKITKHYIVLYQESEVMNSTDDRYYTGLIILVVDDVVQSSIDH